MQKFFTIEEANKALLLVKPIVADILSKMKEAAQIHEEVKIAKEKNGKSEVELLMMLERVEKLLNDVEYHLKELDLIGATIKDLRLGIVDFPCIYQNRTICLCWMPGEEKIMTWHEEYEGLANRKPVDESLLMAAV